MIQFFSLIIATVQFFVFPYSPPQKISIKMEVPAEVHAGREFEVILNIEKGDLEGFSRFVQTLPYGLNAERIQSANGDFTFENQRIRVIWLKLPENAELVVSYKVTVDRILTGSFEMAGEFAYVENNESKVLPVSPGHFIKIIPDPSVAQKERIDIQDFQALAPNIGPKRKGMEVVRSVPVKSGNFEYSVELVIRNNAAGKFAKIEEYIPAGFKVSEGDSRGGIFSFTGKVMKILWSELPKDEEFKINYRLVPDAGQSIENFKVSGSYSYILDNQAISYAITNLEKVLADDNVIASGSGPAGLDPALNGVDKVSERILPAGYLPGEYIPAEAFSSYLQKTDNALYFSVQVGAGHKVIGMKEHFRERGLKDDIKMEYHEGWRKYITGAFRNFEDAKAYRDRILETTELKDAFVTAYSNGKRISVQEALMLK